MRSRYVKQKKIEKRGSFCYNNLNIIKWQEFKKYERTDVM